MISNRGDSLVIMDASNYKDMEVNGDSSQSNTSSTTTSDRNIFNIPHRESQICLLNDDCIIHILKYLSFSDQFNLARACKHFQNAFILCSRLKYKIFDPQNKEFQNLSANEQRELLALVGRHFEILETGIQLNDCTLPALLGEFCPNLSTMKLLSSFKTPNVNQLVDNMQMITVLELHSIMNNIGDPDILSFKKLVKLRKFTVVLSSITGKYLDQLKSLEYLQLICCINLDPFYLINMLEALVELRTLKFWHCKEINVNVCQQMIRHSKKLESLTIDLESKFEIVATLPLLKRLEFFVQHSQQILNACNAPVFNELAKKAKKLEYLKIVMYRNVCFSHIAEALTSLKNLKALECVYQFFLIDKCFDYFSELESLEELIVICQYTPIDEGLLHMLAKCKRLSLVVIVNKRPCVANPTFVHRAIELLRNNNKQRALPVRLQFGLVQDIKLDTEYKNAVVEGIISISYQNYDVYKKERDSRIKNNLHPFKTDIESN